MSILYRVSCVVVPVSSCYTFLYVSTYRNSKYHKSLCSASPWINWQLKAAPSQITENCVNLVGFTTRNTFNILFSPPCDHNFNIYSNSCSDQFNCSVKRKVSDINYQGYCVTLLPGAELYIWLWIWDYSVDMNLIKNQQRESFNQSRHSPTTIPNTKWTWEHLFLWFLNKVASILGEIGMFGMEPAKQGNVLMR